MPGDHPQPEPEAGDDRDVRSNEELTEAAASGLRWIAWARAAIELLLIASMVALARLIPPPEFGIFAVVVVVHELAVSMPMEGVGSAIVQRRSVTADHLRGGLVLSLAVAVALIAGTLLVAALLAEPLFGERTAALIMATTPYYALGAIYAVPMAVLRRRLDFRRLSLVELSLNGARVIATLALAVAGLDAEALVFGSVAGMAVALAVALRFAPVPWPRWRPRAIRDLLPYGGPAALASLAWAGFRNGDYVIIGGTLGAAQAGFYWRSYQLAVEYQRKISVAMAQTAFPVLARTAGSRELLELRQRMVRLLTVVLFPLLALLAVLAPVAVPFLFGPAWEPSVLPAQVLVLGGAATLTIDACGAALMAVGRARALLGYGVAHFLVYALAVLLVAPSGLLAVAIAASAVHLAFLAVAYLVLLRGSAGRPLLVLWRDVTPALACCAALAAAAVPAGLTLAGLGVGALPHLIGAALAGAGAYLLALRRWFPASAHDLAAAVRRVLPARLLRPRARRPALIPDDALGGTPHG